MARRHQLASLQLRIIQVLWDRGEATVAEVREALRRERPLAYTTVATMLAKMEAKGQVAHRSERRVHVYRSAVKQNDVTKTMLRDLSERLFRGDVAEMVSHLLDDCEVSPEELSRLKSLIRKKERESRNDA